MVDKPTRNKDGLRADAARNRAAILKAASRMFDEHGFDVPMSKIAEAAGVGRTTLLRNFPSRMELAAALFEQIMIDMRALVAGQKGEIGDFEALLDLKLEFYIQHGGMTQAFHRANAYSKDFADERDEIAEMFCNASRPAVEAGILRSDLTAETFVILQKAIGGALLSGNGTAQRREAALILKSLLMDGLKARD